MALDYINELKTQALQEVAGVDIPVFERVCRDTAREFCEQTQGWIDKLDPMNLREDVSQYELEAPNDFSCIIVPTRVRIFEPDDQEPVHPDTLQQSTYFQYLMEPDRCVLDLVYAPQRDQVKALHVQVALRPRRDKRQMCERFYDDWYQGLAYGVMSRLMLMPRKQWSDQETGMYYKRLYWDWIGKAKIDRNRRFMNRPLYAFPRFQFAKGGNFERGRQSF